jgi:hypothetical protein
MKFEDITEAMASASALVESKLSKGLKKFLKKNLVDKGIQDTLAVADPKLGGVIKSKLGINCVHDSSSVNELMRGIRLQVFCSIPLISITCREKTNFCYSLWLIFRPALSLLSFFRVFILSLI